MSGRGLIAWYQRHIGAWSDYNFGSLTTDPPGPDTGPAGLTEEVGELFYLVSRMNRCWVKDVQGIRGSHEEWTAEMRKEAADVFIKLTQVCHDTGFSLEDAVAERWAVVSARDFRADRIGHGLPQEA